MNATRAHLFLSVLLFIGVTGCSDDDPYTARIKAIEKNKETLNIAVAWPHDANDRGTKMSIVQGVDLAVNEINSGGGVLGRKIAIKKFSDGRSINKGLMIAQEIAEDKSLFAVIGHLDSYISVPTSTTYEYTGLITMNPGSTDTRLTQPGYPHLFRMIPKNDIQGENLAQHFKALKYKKVLIYYVNNPYGLALANSFESKAISLDISIVDRRGYYKSSRDHLRTMQEWQKYQEFDAIFIAGSMPDGVQVLKAVKDAGIKQPIYAGAGLDSLAFISKGGANAEGTNVVSFFPQSYHVKNEGKLVTNDASIIKFINAYANTYGVPPVEASAALGYDAVYILANAIKKAGSLNRDSVSKEIRNSKNWSGATGTYSFDDKGDVIDKLLVLNRVKNGDFVFVDRIN